MHIFSKKEFNMKAYANQRRSISYFLVFLILLVFAMSGYQELVATTNTHDNDLLAISSIKIDFVPINDPWDLYLANNHALITTQEGIMAIDISDPKNPGSPFNITNDFLCLAIAHYENYLYVVRRNESAITNIGMLSVIDFSDPNSVGDPIDFSLGNAYGPFSLFVYEHYLFLTDEYSIFIFDVTNPSTPTLITEFNYPVGDDFRIKTILNDYAYLFTRDEICIFDVSNLTGITTYPVYELPLLGSISDFEVQGDYGYIAMDGIRGEQIPDLFNGLIQVNMTDKSNLNVTDSIELPDYASCLELTEDKILLGGGAQYYGLYVFAVSDNVIQEDFAKLSTVNIRDMIIKGEYIYLISYSFGFGITTLKPITNKLSINELSIYFASFLTLMLLWLRKKTKKQR